MPDIQITGLGEDGDFYIAQGHHAFPEFRAALRTFLLEQECMDEEEVDEALANDCLTHEHGFWHSPPEYPDDEYWQTCPPEAKGAEPVTVARL